MLPHLKNRRRPDRIAEVDAGVFTGEVRSREDAIELARKPRAG